MSAPAPRMPLPPSHRRISVEPVKGVYLYRLPTGGQVEFAEDRGPWASYQRPDGSTVLAERIDPAANDDFTALLQASLDEARAEEDAYLAADPLVASARVQARVAAIAAGEIEERAREEFRRRRASRRTGGRT